MFDDVFNGMGGVGGGLAGREVDGGDLEAVEQESGAAGVEFVGGEAEEDFSDGGLDGGSVFGAGEGEGGFAGADALLRFPFWDGLPIYLMVVAEVLFFEAG